MIIQLLGKSAKVVSKTATSNAVYSASDYDADGFDVFTVAVPNGTETKNITENGEYTPTSPNIGFSSVTVAVPVPAHYIEKPVSSNVLQNPSTLIDLTGVTDISASALRHAYSSNANIVGPVDFSSLTALSGRYAISSCFEYAPNITTADLSGLTTISGDYAIAYCFKDSSVTSADLSSLATVSGYYGMYQCFKGSKIINLNLSSLTTISGNYGMQQCCTSCTSLVSVDMSSLETISGDRALYDAFSGCTGLGSLDFSALTTVSGASAMQHCFYNCPLLTTGISFPSLTTISGDTAMNETFSGCYYLTEISMPVLETISGEAGLSRCFMGTGLVSITFPSLTTLTGVRALYECFYNCGSLTSVSFPALKSDSFGVNTNQFYGMLRGCTGVTVHFPSNLQSVIGSWSDVTNGFFGTNTTVLFDLTATE